MTAFKPRHPLWETRVRESFARQPFMTLIGGEIASLSPGACAVALPPLRAALRALLHYHLGSQTLRTRQVMADVRKLLEPQPEHP